MWVASVAAQAMKPPAQVKVSTLPCSTSPVRVLLVEDHAFVRELIAHLLERETGRFRVVAEAATATAAVSACREQRPDLVILDLNLTGGQDGSDAMAALRRVHPTVRILVCSGSCDEAKIAHALRAGPDGFVDKAAETLTFLAAVAAVAAGGRFLCPRSARVYAAMGQGRHGQPTGRVDGRKVNDGQRGPDRVLSTALTMLTGREREVLALVIGGHTSKEAAEVLGVSLATVVSHRTNLMRKLDMHNAAELTRYALAQGVQPQSPRP